MKFTKTSKELMTFFNENNCIDEITHSKKIDTIFTKIYNDIDEAFSTEKKELIKKKVIKIQNIHDIPMPKTFSSNDFPVAIRNHINEMVTYHLSYSISLFNRNITFHFIVEDENPDEKYNEYAEHMLIWIYILNKYASQTCSKDFTVFLYFTSLLKKLPQSNVDVLDVNNANTAFTRTCPTNSEIVIYRKEEWFKVFIHETFHNFSLDFSDMNTDVCHNIIRKIFPVNSDINLFESYTEFWARIMNVCFCSYISLLKNKNKNKNNVLDFLKNVEVFIHIERLYSFFQLVKTLEFMGLNYIHLYSKTIQSQILRDNLYKEKTNILAYYIIQTILMNNYNGFLLWCETNNTTLFQFKKTLQNQKDFCKFIEKNYKSTSMLYNIECMKILMKQLKNSNHRKYTFLLHNMRMTVCEIL